jgi:hypothetical protein
MSVKHILADGRVEEHIHAIKRLIAMLEIPENDMFRSGDAVINEAYMRQGKDIAYREQSPDNLNADQKRYHGASGTAE